MIGDTQNFKKILYDYSGKDAFFVSRPTDYEKRNNYNNVYDICIFAQFGLCFNSVTFPTLSSVSSI